MLIIIGQRAASIVFSLLRCLAFKKYSRVDVISCLTSVILDEYGMSDFSNDVFAVVDSFSIKKKDVYIYGITTPSKISGAAHQLWQQKNSLYERIEVPWQQCVGKMFSKEQLQKLKDTSPSFTQEFECRFGFSKEGMTFSPKSVDKTIELGKSVQVNEYAPKYMGIDCGLSSPFGFTVIQFVDGYAQVKYAAEISQKNLTTDQSDMVQKAVELINQYSIKKAFVDGSAVSYIRS